MKLTTANIELPEGKTDHLVFDSELIGFALRVRRGSGGRLIRNWIVAYRAHGHQRRMIVGDAVKVSAADARKKAKKLLSEVELGGDPQADKHQRRDRDELTLRAVIKDFLDHKGGAKPGTLQALAKFLQGPSGRRAQRQGLKPYLAPLLGMPVDRITRADVARRILSISKEHGAATAIVLRSKLSSLFSWAMQVGLVDQNPVVGAVKPDASPSRDRVLSDAELRAVWRGVADDDYGKIVKLMILCGARRNEIGGMRFSELNDDDTWTLPKERSKNGKAHTLPLTPLMLKIIGSVPIREGNDHLFGKGGFSAWSKSKAALDQKLALPAWILHDVRRSVATGMANIGIQPHIIEQILNHQSGHKAGVAGTYNRSIYANEVRAAMALWSDHIRTLIEGGARKIVAFERAAASTP